MCEIRTQTHTKKVSCRYVSELKNPAVVYGAVRAVTKGRVATSGGEFLGTSCKESSGKKMRGGSACPELCWAKAFPVCETGVNKEKDQLIWEVPPASCKAPVPHSTGCKPLDACKECLDECKESVFCYVQREGEIHGCE